MTSANISEFVTHLHISRLEKPLKKSGLVMEIIRKRSDPPPLFSEVMEPVRHNLILVTKGEKLNYPKTPKMALFNINLFGKNA